MTTSLKNLIETHFCNYKPFYSPLPSDYFVCLAYVLFCTFYVACCFFVFAICQNTPNPFPAPTYPGGGPLPWTPHRFQTNRLKRKTDNPGGRPWAAYPFPTRLLPIEYFPLPLRNISLPPRKIVHFCHRAGVSSHFIFP